MYEINNMKLRYTLIGVLCFSINIVLQAQQQALEGKIAGFLKGKKATVGVAVTDGRLVVDPRPQPRYTMAELLAASDYSQPQTAEEREWVDAPAVGRELI